MKKVVKALFKIYDVIAHIIGHIVLFVGIVGGLVYQTYISYQKDELYIILIELIIILVILALVMYAIIKFKK